VLAATQPSALSVSAFTFQTSSDCPTGIGSPSVPRGTMERLSLRIDGGAARYRLTGGATGAVDVTSDREEICLRDRTTSSRGDLRISQLGANFGGRSEILVKVANDLPLSLNVNAGAGAFVIDLSDVKTIDAHFSVGASNTTVILPRPTGDVPVRLDGGASNITIEIPSDVEARVIVSGGLVTTTSQSPRATKSGNVVETPGYNVAKDRVTVTVNSGASSIIVR
jgi:hypothetical protein